ncbi:hypothetical protein EJ06DRAFT_530588 [Trichodelitschia bisporula]|uniref:Uncharacterized protein n=1 Tax=Trichodelitschia bisporula TaxID=703511 RepID=A0A6G1HV62_9PEZI|nr:hypothetical protein EJ06DRAFT_530588 [Trichodelitschia bisporula]
MPMPLTHIRRRRYMYLCRLRRLLHPPHHRRNRHAARQRQRQGNQNHFHNRAPKPAAGRTTRVAQPRALRGPRPTHVRPVGRSAGLCAPRGGE